MTIFTIVIQPFITHLPSFVWVYFCAVFHSETRYYYSEWLIHWLVIECWINRLTWHPYRHSFVHSFIRSFAHLFTHSLTLFYLFIHSFIHSLTIFSLTHSIFYSLTHLITSFIHSYIHSIMHSFAHSSIYQFTHAFRIHPALYQRHQLNHALCVTLLTS